jgi:hypothetical protein
MTTFFAIFFVLILLNAALLTFSVVMNKRNQAGISGEQTDSAQEKVYPLDLSSPDYRKAI